MTNDLLHYGPPATTTPPTREIAGKVLTVLFAVVGPPAAGVTAIIAAITWSDCFFACSGDPDHLTGGLLWLLALSLLLAAPVLAATLVRRAAWVVGAVAVPVVEVLLLGINLTH